MSNQNEPVSQSLQEVDRFYGIDFGSRSISITRIDYSTNPRDANPIDIQVLTDGIGKRIIFNGMQYCHSNHTTDPAMYYKNRKFGNDCHRSNPIISISPQKGDDYGETDIMIDGTTHRIDLNYSEVMIAGYIKKIIDADISKSTEVSRSLRNIKAVFAISSSLSCDRRQVIRSHINELFNFADTPIKTEFMTSDIALSYSAFYLRYPDYPNKSIKPSLINDMRKTTPIQDNDEAVDLIIDASHTQTTLSIVSTSYDKLERRFNLKYLNRYSVFLSGQLLDLRIRDLIIDAGVSRFGNASRCDLESKIHIDRQEITKIKHDLSMYDNVTCTIDIGEYVFTVDVTRESALNEEIITQMSVVTDIIHGLKREYGFNNIELVGGFSRSFVIQNCVQDTLREIQSNRHYEFQTTVRHSMNADEAVSNGAALSALLKDVERDQDIYKGFKKRKFDFEYQFNSQPSTISIYATNSPTYHETIEFNTAQYRDYRGSDAKSQIRMIKIHQTCPDIRIVYEDIKFSITPDNFTQNTNGQTYDMYFEFDMLGIPRVQNITKDSCLEDFINYNVTFGPNMQYSEAMLVQNNLVESELRRCQNLSDRIGSLINKMEGIYFDRSGYSARKQSIADEIAKVKNRREIDDSDIHKNLIISVLRDKLRKLIDTYEFCRIVAIEEDLLTDSNYKPDSDLTIDTRLTRSTIDSLIKNERGLTSMELMMNSVSTD
jgi:hypothetical protein